MNFLSKTSNVQRSAVIWNAVSACLTSFQTMLLLMVLTHFGTPEHSGYFVMAYTAANLLMHLGKFGMRQYQVTDAGNKYSFREYVASRVFSVGLMAAALVLYLLYSLLFNGYTAEKAAVVALITFYRGVEAAEDVQVILGLEEDAQYKVYIDDVNTGTMETNMGGKLVLSIETTAGRTVPVKVVKI